MRAEPTASFGVGLDAHLNPLGMDKRRESEDFGTQVAFKADAMIAQAAAAANETMTVFSEEERSIIQRLRREYLPPLQHGGRPRAPSSRISTRS